MTPKKHRAETAAKQLKGERSVGRHSVLQLLYDYLSCLNEDLWFIGGFVVLVPFNLKVSAVLGIPESFSGYEFEWSLLAFLLCLVSALLTMLVTVTLEMAILLISATCLRIDMDQTPTELVSMVCVARVVAVFVAPIAVGAGLVLSRSAFANPLGVAFFGTVAAFVFEVVVYRYALMDMMYLSRQKAALLVTAVVVVKCVITAMAIVGALSLA